MTAGRTLRGFWCKTARNRKISVNKGKIEPPHLEKRGNLWYNKVNYCMQTKVEMNLIMTILSTFEQAAFRDCRLKGESR